MTGVSHAITGATVALVVKEPLLALPLAFVSHFICDMIPHVGTADITDPKLKQKRAFLIYKIDLVLILTFFAYLFVAGAPMVVIAGAFLAGSPDFVWFYRTIVLEKLRGKNPGKQSLFSRWHSNIQWSETVKFGLPVELIYGSILLVYITNQL